MTIDIHILQTRFKAALAIILCDLTLKGKYLQDTFLFLNMRSIVL